ncbi:DMT family transporter [Rhodobaculum claviforme]|uniref:EamA-like transporter family protein n=1 Tax=Rhodobaculum claviforme TaxID=1549854 RepID=A0A934TLB8_9RHOB|nr:DMT family transporter [Rhodobaculum claviforme]MBK5927138.1 hypothetical protein [Rhodobaculum claviforme]
MQARAAAMIALGMGTIALVDNWVRLVTPEMGLWQYQLLRALVCAALLLGVAPVMGWRLRLVRPWAVWLRSAVAALAVMLYFGALAVMTISQAGAGMFTAPVFVLVISVLAFGLPVGPVRSLAVAMGFAGVLVVLRPWGAGGLAVWAAALAVSAGVCHAAGAVLTRQLCAEEPTAGMTLVHFTALGLWGALGLVAVTVLAPEVAPGPEGWFARGWVWPSAAALGWTAANAVGSTVAMGLVIRAYQIAEASRIAVFEYSFLPLAALWAWVLFGDLPDVATALGTGLIVAAGTLILWRTPATRP